MSSRNHLKFFFCERTKKWIPHPYDRRAARDQRNIAFLVVIDLIVYIAFFQMACHVCVRFAKDCLKSTGQNPDAQSCGMRTANNRLPRTPRHSGGLRLGSWMCRNSGQAYKRRRDRSSNRRSTYGGSSHPFTVCHASLQMDWRWGHWTDWVMFHVRRPHGIGTTRDVRRCWLNEFVTQLR